MSGTVAAQSIGSALSPIGREARPESSYSQTPATSSAPSVQAPFFKSPQQIEASEDSSTTQLAIGLTAVAALGLAAYGIFRVYERRQYQY